MIVITFVLLLLKPMSSEAQGFDQDDVMKIKLSCTSIVTSSKQVGLVFKGQCNLPDYATLELRLLRLTETASEDEIHSVLFPVDIATCKPKEGKFEYEFVPGTPGRYYVKLQLLAPVYPDGKKREWGFEFLAWDDAFIGKVAPMLTKVQALISETKDLIEKLELASVNERDWSSSSKTLFLEGLRLKSKLRDSELKPYYPAAMKELYYTIRDVVDNESNYAFANGKFEGPRKAHAERQNIKTHRNEEFTWPNLKRSCDSAVDHAGREFCLWILRDVSRTDRKIRPEVQALIAAYKDVPGVEHWQERLQKITAEKMGTLEALIRTPLY